MCLGSLKLGLALVLLDFILVLHGKECAINTGFESLHGICTNLQDCPAALSNLYSGIEPQICTSQTETAGTANSMVCCPNTERVSERSNRITPDASQVVSNTLIGKIRKKSQNIITAVNSNGFFHFSVCDLLTMSGLLTTECKEFDRIRIESEEAGPVPLLPLEFVEDRMNSQNQNKVHCKRQPVKMIVGGRDATAQEFPHMAALGYGLENEEQWLCGGTLISESFVMTAAHCTVATPEPLKRVLVGSIKLSHEKKRQIIEVDKVIVHPKYLHSSVYFDIALVRLKSKVKLTSSILPACLPQPKLRLEKINITQVTGWGLLETGGSQSDILQAVHLSRFPQKRCQALYDDKLDKQLRYPGGIQRSQFCAGTLDGNKDSCNGDSGGPVTVNLKRDPCVHYVVGIVSFGNVVCGVEPAVYTTVQSYLDWIETTVWS